VEAIAIFIYDFNLEVLIQQIQVAELRRWGTAEYVCSNLFIGIYWELQAA
jgi:hypothetical protein